MGNTMTRERGSLYPGAGVDRFSKTKQPSIWPVRADEIFTTEVLQKYRDENAEELMMALGDGKHIVPEQQRDADEVMFSDRALLAADEELHAAWAIASPEEGMMTHSHIMENGHGIGPDGKVFSGADEKAMKQLHASYGKDRFGLVINGHEVHGEVAFQHVIVADHTGELLKQEWSAGAGGKVMTTYLDDHGDTQRVYSQTIQEAEKKSARVVQMKELEHEVVKQRENALVQMQIAWLKEKLLSEAA